MSLQTIYLVSDYVYGSLLTVPQLYIVIFCIMTLCNLVGGCQCLCLWGWNAFHLENEVSMFLWNIHNHLPDCTLP